ncbi:CbtB domain-containing protein [Micromonospora sp. CA-111912]|uniref:CbtB domain-containing protein n=1 Tax=Micromonospora sp. CA-111912 TaxID=3239955 RepID=UPI003D8B21DB
MSQATTAVPAAVPSIPVRELAPWALFFSLLTAVVLFFVGAEQGAFSVFEGTAVHELVHDARHVLGYPCH